MWLMCGESFSVEAYSRLGLKLIDQISELKIRRLELFYSGRDVSGRPLLK